MKNLLKNYIKNIVRKNEVLKGKIIFFIKFNSRNKSSFSFDTTTKNQFATIEVLFKEKENKRIYRFGENFRGVFKIHDPFYLLYLSPVSSSVMDLWLRTDLSVDEIIDEIDSSDDNILIKHIKENEYEVIIH